MRILIVGAGAVGMYFGARLAAVGHDVCWVARGATRERMLRDGVLVESIHGDIRLPPQTTVVEDATGLDPVDLVLVAVKTWQVEDIAPQLRDVVHDNGAVLPLQNGVEAPMQIAKVVGDRRVLGGFCKILCHVVEPGYVRHTGAEPVVVFGELAGVPTERRVLMLDAFASAGIRGELSDDIAVEMWQKFLFITATAGVGAVSRAPLGLLLQMPETRSLLEQAMTEVFAVGRARGIAMPDDSVARGFALMESLPADTIASMHRDIVAGRPSELEALNGGVVRLGREVGVPTPVNEMLYVTLLPSERKARGLID